ncbi:MAG: hypothetical protein E6J90_23430 [Deltaproteobacteria bacterium]|nr:MAG: hypothetical protein E6J90_23430 [Deltaproteobacteria bacterium]
MGQQDIGEAIAVDVADRRDLHVRAERPGEQGRQRRDIDVAGEIAAVDDVQLHQLLTERRPALPVVRDHDRVRDAIAIEIADHDRSVEALIARRDPRAGVVADVALVAPQQEQVLAAAAR